MLFGAKQKRQISRCGAVWGGRVRGSGWWGARAAGVVYKQECGPGWVSLRSAHNTNTMYKVRPSLKERANLLLLLLSSPSK